jgi:hypothetical protein
MQPVHERLVLFEDIPLGVEKFGVSVIRHDTDQFQTNS